MTWDSQSPASCWLLELKKPSKPRKRMAPLLILLSVLLSVFVACGGGGDSGGGNGAGHPGTPPGKYTITVNGVVGIDHAQCAGGTDGAVNGKFANYIDAVLRANSNAPRTGSITPGLTAAKGCWERRVV